MTLFCMVCGGEHQPDAAICNSEGMDRRIEVLGCRRWNELTAAVSRIKNKANKQPPAASDREERPSPAQEPR